MVTLRPGLKVRRPGCRGAPGRPSSLHSPSEGEEEPPVFKGEEGLPPRGSGRSCVAVAHRRGLWQHSSAGVLAHLRPSSIFHQLQVQPRAHLSRAA